MTSSDENMFLKSVELWVYYCIIKLWTRKCPYLYSQPLGKCCIATTVCALLVISSAQTMHLSGKQSGTQSLISWAYYPTVVRTNEILRLQIDCDNMYKVNHALSGTHTHSVDRHSEHYTTLGEIKT